LLHGAEITETPHRHRLMFSLQEENRRSTTVSLSFHLYDSAGRCQQMHLSTNARQTEDHSA